MVGGFVLVVVGVGLWSIAAALVLAGLVLFVAGGVDQARASRSRK